jgi:hypothetical protein
LKGVRLVSSPLDELRTHSDDPEGKSVRLLKRFPRPLGGSYNLDQLSPSGQVALVRRSFAIGDGWGNTYCVVNVLTGKTDIISEDRVCGIDNHRVSYMHWVGANEGVGP